QVDEEPSALGEDAHDLLQDAEVLPLGLEVAERSEKVEHPVEAAGGERQPPHVAGHPRKVIPRQQGQRQIDAQRTVAPAPQHRRMASGAAGEIQHRPRPRSAEMPFNEVDVLLGLGLVAVGVQLQVLLAEPFLVPGHRGMISEALCYPLCGPFLTPGAAPPWRPSSWAICSTPSRPSWSGAPGAASAGETSSPGSTSPSPSLSCTSTARRC